MTQNEDWPVVTIAQVGCGYWGPNLLRNFNALSSCRVKYVAEYSEERRAFVERTYQNTRAVATVEELLADAEVRAIVIATPPATHAALALQCLNAGKHVFVEKPLAMRSADVDAIAARAADVRRIVMVGHSFLYNPAVEYLRDLVASGALGRVHYAYAQRLNLGVVRTDVDAMWNLGPHDISILIYVLGALPIAVNAIGSDYLQPGIADVVFLNLLFADNVRASVHVSWLDPNKVRRTTVVGSRKMAVYDDMAEGKIAIYDKGIDYYKPEMAFDQPTPERLVYRTGDVLLPRIQSTEPLRRQAEHFIECVRTGATPKTGVRNAREVVSVLEAAKTSMRSQGSLVSVAYNAAMVSGATR